MADDLKTYKVMVPVLLELEVKSAIEPADLLASVMELFADKSKDPLLGANLATAPLIGRGLWIARTRGAELFGGRAYLKEAGDDEAGYTER